MIDLRQRIPRRKIVDNRSRTASRGMGSKGGVDMRRIKSACIMQTLIFMQDPEAHYSVEEELKLNREELDGYKKKLEAASVRYLISDVVEKNNGHIIVRVRKQYNDHVDASEYLK